MRRILAMSLVLAGVVTSLGQAGEVKYALNGDNTKITFVGVKPGKKHDGGFKKLTGTATITGTDATTLKLVVDIDLNSTWTDENKLTDHLKTADFFDVKNNPKATFTSTKIEKKGDGYTVAGKLALNGKTKDVSFPAKIDAKDGSIALSSSFKINRHNWGISYGKGLIEDDINLSVSVAAKK